MLDLAQSQGPPTLSHQRSGDLEQIGDKNVDSPIERHEVDRNDHNNYW